MPRNEAINQAQIFNWMRLMYAELTSLPEWPKLSPEARAEKLLARYEAELKDPRGLHRGMFPHAVTRREKLETMSKVIRSFEDQDRQ